jgi:hypothetical protein
MLAETSQHHDRLGDEHLPRVQFFSRDALDASTSSTTEILGADLGTAVAFARGALGHVLVAVAAPASGINGTFLIAVAASAGWG